MIRHCRLDSRTGSAVVVTIVASMLLSWSCSQENATTGGQAVEIIGEGATFPAVLYERWIGVYDDPSVKSIQYKPTGSSAGIQAIMERRVDFAGSEAAMTDDQLSQAGDILHIPITLAPVAVVYNVPGVADGLRLTPETLAGIFLGEITRWNDPKIVQVNPDAGLRDLPIKVVHRSDGSGTTKVFTEYLSHVSSQWKEQVGSKTSVKWPVGSAAYGNAGVAQVVRRSEGGIGYVVLAFARPNRLRMASLWNRTGVFVTPSLDTATAAAASSARSMPTDLRTSMVDLEGDLAYPITAFSYMLIPREVDDPARGLALARFAWWAIHQGQSFAPFLAYATLPPDVVAKASARLKEMESGGQRLLAE